MLTSLALIFLLGMASGGIFKRIKLPSLLGMLLTGIILGPYVLNLIDNSILDISSELRKIALIIILTRAGLSLDINDLKKVGRPAVLMCFIPATFEIIGMIVLAPKLLGVSILEAAVMGAVVGAVSPAIIVPKMLKLMEEGYGTEKSIPQMLLAGTSIDDIFVIVMFTVFTGLAQGNSISAISFLQIPVSIILGAIAGAVIGICLAVFFKKVHMRDSAKGVLLLSISFLMISLETALEGIVPFSGLLAVMNIGIFFQIKYRVVARRLSVKYSKLWVGAEILLFVLVGATVDISYAFKAGIGAVILIFGVLLFRMVGVFFCLIKTNLTIKERLFCMIGYIPKATVQAAIGGVPLAMGIASGQLILTLAVLAILITAPLGAFGIDVTYKKLLTSVEGKSK
ncbi:TPA: cation:proton antiporter [Clostridioides difficile]|uniref:cation:proton antiporter n=1 Tax=Clostridioides difficile TaxID=1496 RepID=UPI00093BD282|nr:cation:proton antiporter [Clostridioides difficile]EGT5082047.1 sodium:proton antiporter [Clostridioides difficile]EGT5136221.1 sodium:proton antiporter [Clostridioides difficile]EGT5283660.1 sodium:proton antiporter [Clostridioides difficile]EII6783235.1 cation:proton antiporter [Clostridioides difficile]MBG0212983.1 cation:proton antiporter [Clostridioides difficile]